MSRVRIPLDLIDSSITGIYMENLISCWCDRGLTLKHAKVFASILSTWTKRDDLFIRCLEKEKSLFEETRGQIMRYLDIWEEVPAWDEVWRIKLAFDRGRTIDWHPNVKLYTVIVCRLLPEMIMERDEEEHPHPWGTRAGDLLDLSRTPSWYQEKVEQYQVRQAERERARLKDQESMLRYRSLTYGAFINRKASRYEQLAHVPLYDHELERLLEEPRLYPLDWWASLEKAGVNILSYKPSDSSPWQQPDFISAQKHLSSAPTAPSYAGVFGGTSNKLFGASPFTSSAPKASSSTFPSSSSTSLFGGTSPFTVSAPTAPSHAGIFGGTNKVFGASPLPPDFTSSASKASSSTFPSSSSTSLFGGTSPFTVSAPTAPSHAGIFGGTNKVFGASPLPPDFTSSASKASSSTLPSSSSTSLFGRPSPLPPNSSSASKASSSTFPLE